MRVIKPIYPFTTITLSIYTTSFVPNRNRSARYCRRLLDTAAAVLWNTMSEEYRNAVNVIYLKTKY